MSGNRFRLASVLKVARLRQQAAERALSQRQAEALQAQRLSEDRAADVDSMGAPEGGDVDTFRLSTALGQLRARAAAEAAAAHLATLDELSGARHGWQAASRSVKSLERLEERHVAERATMAALLAQRALDDLARRRRPR